METKASSAVQAIDASTLTPIVRQSLHRDNFQILDWHMSQAWRWSRKPCQLWALPFRRQWTGSGRADCVVGHPKSHSIPGKCGLGQLWRGR